MNTGNFKNNKTFENERGHRRDTNILEESKTNTYKIVNSPYVGLRNATSDGAKKLIVLEEGFEVTMIQEIDEWFKVIYTYSVTKKKKVKEIIVEGYIRKKYLEEC